MSSRYFWLLSITVITYVIASKCIFNRVFETIHIVVDELFHIPQGTAYCHWNFTYWNPKITTLPGLYLVTALTLGPLFECNTYNLRYINLVASVINLILFVSILQFVYRGNTYLKTVLQGLNLALLPPLYFFSHVYYTDTLSLTFLLIFFRLCFVNDYKLLILIVGLCSILMRQTNVIWVAVVFGHKFLEIFLRSSRVFGNKYLTKLSLPKRSVLAKEIDKTRLKYCYDFYDFLTALRYHISTCFKTFYSFLTIQDIKILLTHIIIILTFVAFVLINGSIVVGDKNAHLMTLNVPQIFYFLLFYGFFGLPFVIVAIPKTLRIIWSNKILTILLAVSFYYIAKYNTVFHPYTLADNRHYIFYIWNRWYGKFDEAKTYVVPAYVYLLFSLYANLRDNNCITFLLPYSVGIFLSLALQKMLEMRYFLVPYIMARLRFGRPTLALVLTELVWYLVINVLTFNIFFTKEVRWRDYDYIQRIIW